MRVFITGGAGFIGANLVEFHLARGDRVTAIDDLSTGFADNVAAFADYDTYQFERGDIVDWRGLDRVVASADRIYHMAAVVGMFRVLNQPVEVTRVNVMGTERLLEAVAASGRRPQVIIPSSSCVYATSNPDELREDVDLNVSPGARLLNYGLSKLTNEVQGLSYARKYNLPIVIARLFNTVGPRQRGTYGFVLPRFVEQALSGQPITIFGDGMQTRSFCDVRDTVAILDALADTPEAHGEVVNVGNDRDIRIKELAKLIRQHCGSNSPLEFIPTAKAYGHELSEILQRRPILDKMRSLTGYSHKWSLEKTIDDLITRSREAPNFAREAAE